MTILLTRVVGNMIVTKKYSNVIRLESHREKGIVSFSMKAEPEQSPLLAWGLKLDGVIQLEVGRDKDLS